MPGEFSFGAITLRHCAVQFGELTPSQKVDLEYFIRANTPAGVGASRSAHVERREWDQVALDVC